MTLVTETDLAHRHGDRPRVILTRRLLPAVEARMAELFELVDNPGDVAMTREQLAAAMSDCDVLVPTVTDRIDAELIAAAGTRLGLIANFGAGTEHIDIEAARARGIVVTNTPAVFTDDTADLTMALILFVMRRFGVNEQVLRRGEWSGWGPSAMLGSALSGKRLGIVGMGRIGQAVAHRARAFGLEVTYHNRRRLPTALETMFGARYEADLDRLITESDILTLHCPALPGGTALMDARRLAAMKPTACLINTGRGQLVDEPALIDALANGHIAGAGLDVFANEPQINPQLLALPNLVALPHLGSATHEGRGAAGEKIIANIRFWVDGHRPPDQVLPQLS